MSLISTVVLVLLVAAWGWVLGRPLLQSFMSKSQRDPVGHFNRQLSVLGNAPRQSNALNQPMGLNPRLSTMRGSSMKRRRLQWFMALVMAAVVSLILAVVLRGVFIWQHILIDVFLVAYVALAARVGAIERERASKVTNLRVIGASEAQPSYLRAAGER